MVVERTMHQALQLLRTRGWVVEIAAAGGTLPLALRHRYPHLPAQVASFLAEIETCHNHRDDAWIFGSSVFAREEPAGFRWNECEIMSLAAVEGGLPAARQIREYWDHHLPFMMAVHSDCDYLAVQTGPALPLGAVVHGCAPEFEDSTVVAPSFDAFLTGLRDAALSADPPFPFSIFL